MISKIISRIAKLQTASLLSRFSIYDDFKNKNQGEKTKFFKNAGKSQTDNVVKTQDNTAEDKPAKQNQHKTIKFLKKNQYKTHEFDNTKHRQMKFKKYLVDSKKPFQSKQASTIESTVENEEPDQNTQSIFFQTKGHNGIGKDSLPTLQYLELQDVPQPVQNSKYNNKYKQSPMRINKFKQNTKSGKMLNQRQRQIYIDRNLGRRQKSIQEIVLQQERKIITYFNNKNWQQINVTLDKYRHMQNYGNALYEFANLFVSTNCQYFIEWLQYNQYTIEEQGEQIYTRIISYAMNNMDRNINLIKFLLPRMSQLRIPLQLSLIDKLFKQIDYNWDREFLSRILLQKLEIAIDLIQIHHRYTEQVQINLLKQVVKKQNIGIWFTRILQVSLDRGILVEEVRQVFQLFLQKYCYFMKLDDLYGNDVFADLIQKYYFGSDIKLNHLKLLLEDCSFYKRVWPAFMLKLHKKMQLYVLKKNNSPFPEINDAFRKFQKSTSKNSKFQFILYYLLSLHSIQYNRIAREQLQMYGQDFISVLEPNPYLRQILEYAALNVDKQQIQSISQRQPIDYQKEGYNNKYVDILREQFQWEQNQNRKDLLGIILDQNDPLSPLKAAIKLGKNELAYYLAFKYFMEDRVIERTRKNICFTVQALLRDHTELMYEPYLQQIKIAIKPSVMKFSKSFLMSIYDRLQNFDQLLWNYLPPFKEKHLFWESTLTLSRAEELLKMDVSDKLKNLSYLQEFDTNPIQEKDQFMQTNRGVWRSALMQELGITEGTRVSEGFVPFNDNSWKSYNTQKEFFDQLVTAEQSILNQIPTPDAAAGQNLEEPAEEIQANQQGQGELNQEEKEPIEAEGEEIAAEGEEIAAEGEEIAAEGEEIAAEGEEIAAEGEEIAAEGEEVAAGQNGQAVSKGENVAANGNEQMSNEEQKQLQENEAADNEKANSSLQNQVVQNIYEHSQYYRIKGYDFTAFMKLARTKLKPMFEQSYEEQKQFKKHMLALESLAQEARIMDNQYLQKRLLEFQENVKYPYNIQLFKQFQLWDYDFLNVEVAEEYMWLADDFRQKFFIMKKYRALKGIDKENPNLAAEPLQNFTNLTLVRETSQALVEQILFKRQELFKEAEAVVKLQPCLQIQNLMIWGLRNDEPMAIYIGQKIAMLTNQTISHNVASLVSAYLSHSRDIPYERIERCKQCLKITGRINREHIYDINHEYEHITVRKHFNKYLHKREVELNSTSLAFMQRVDPIHRARDDNLNLMNNLRRHWLA